ncbi:MAG: sporulation integral membrane protein YtvI [Oscillospiraceae bacterium]|nr:sporulation integral membrane protein YtvI [Oscillospiraceae bacterium]
MGKVTEKGHFLRRGAMVIGGIIAFWLGLRYLLPPVLPFVIAFLLSVATEPLGQRLKEKSGLSATASGIVVLLGVYLVLGLGCWFLGKILLRELSRLWQYLPYWAENLRPALASLREKGERLFQSLPDDLGNLLRSSADGIYGGIGRIMEKIPATMLNFFTHTAKKVPSFLLAFVTTLVAGFFMAGRLDALRRGLSRILPKPWRKHITTLWQKSRGALKGWLMAESKLSAVTFLITTSGFLFLRVPFPLLLGLCTAVVDFLPVLGAGTVLIPWALWCFVQGARLRALSLVLLYAVTITTRTMLEPRLVGKHMGIPPLLTLFSAYVGARFFGILGLVLFPLVASVVCRVREWGSGA